MLKLALVIGFGLGSSLYGCASVRVAAPPEERAENQLASAPAAGPAGPDDKLICRREKVVGSHMKQEVCEYESERRRKTEDARRTFVNGAPLIPE